jgi:hypothetical protein
MMTCGLLAALALTASGDNIQFHEDCSQYVARYKALLLDRAHRDVEAARDAGAVPPPPLRIEAAIARVETQVARSCRVANRSQYECVVQAQLYEDLQSCQLEALPVLDAAQRSAPPPPPPTPEERARATKSFAREYASHGTTDLEALDTGSGFGAGPAEQPAAGAAASGE